LPDYAIQSPEGNPVNIIVIRDGRLKKSARWVRDSQDSISLRVPKRTTRRQIELLLEDIEQQLAKQEQLAQRRNDDNLHARAQRINKKHFRGNIQFTAIRWVGNMNKRLGSCTNGGVTDGHIRISDKMQNWPEWVVDYVIAHELAHRVYPNHSSDFWQYLEEAYPLTERARGFIMGVGFSSGVDFAVDEDS